MITTLYTRPLIRGNLPPRLAGMFGGALTAVFLTVLTFEFATVVAGLRERAADALTSRPDT